VKKVTQLRNKDGQRVTTAERVMRYMAKYFLKSFSVRLDAAYCEKIGLLRGTGIAKFYR
jgi:hypothetical protein